MNKKSRDRRDFLLKTGRFLTAGTVVTVLGFLKLRSKKSDSKHQCLGNICRSCSRSKECILPRGKSYRSKVSSE